MWKLVLTTFTAVFIAELGDKTQLATLGLAAESKAPLAIFLGSALALICTSLIAAVAGGFVSKYIAPVMLQRAAGALFLVLGAWTLWKSTSGG